MIGQFIEFLIAATILIAFGAAAFATLAMGQELITQEFVQGCTKEVTRIGYLIGSNL